MSRRGEEDAIVVTLLAAEMFRPISQRSRAVYSATGLPTSSPLSASVLSIWRANNVAVESRSWGGVGRDLGLAWSLTVA